MRPHDNPSQLPTQQMVVGLLGRFVDVRRQSAPDEGIAQLHPQEARRRIARDAPVVPLDERLHHLGPRLDQLRRDLDEFEPPANRRNTQRSVT